MTTMDERLLLWLVPDAWFAMFDMFAILGSRGYVSRRALGAASCTDVPSNTLGTLGRS